MQVQLNKKGLSPEDAAEELLKEQFREVTKTLVPKEGSILNMRFDIGDVHPQRLSKKLGRSSTLLVTYSPKQRLCAPQAPLSQPLKEALGLY